MSKGINHSFDDIGSVKIHARCKHCKGFEYEHPTARCSNVGTWTYALGEDVPFIKSTDAVVLYGVDGRSIGTFYYCPEFEAEDS